MATDHTYVCIDLKSFYASVECVDRGLDPFVTNLVVADPTRTSKTICLAITPAMKELGIRNRCRVFEIPDDVDYIMARPRMRRYMEVSADIYAIYLRYVSPEDIHVYSVDECFIDVTPYLSLYDTTARDFAVTLMDAVFAQTGICATAGIGTNLFLAKLALDITAKHVPDHIGYLDQEAFERTIQTHRPITDIWSIGPGIAARLAKYDVHDLLGITRLDATTLHREFGINAQLLADHARGIEPCTIAQIQAYRPTTHSLVNGQVLACGYSHEQAEVVLKEMIDQLVLDLVDKHLVVGSISLSVGYERIEGAVPHTGGSRKQHDLTNSLAKLRPRFLELWESTTRTDIPIRRMALGAGDLMPEEYATCDLFEDREAAATEQRLQRTVLAVKGKFGKNALLRGISLTPGATARERNEQVGGHHA